MSEEGWGRFRTQNIEISVANLVQWVEKKDLTVEPAYRHSFSWSVEKQSAYIESLLAGIPNNNLWFEQQPNGQFEVIDGTQRLLAIIAFINGKFALTDLSLYRHLEGLLFSEVEYKYQVQLKRCDLRIGIINHDIQPGLKYEFYRRYNIDNKYSNEQQALNFTYRNAFEAFSRLKEALAPWLIFDEDKKASATNFQTQINTEYFLLCISLISLFYDHGSDSVYNRNDRLKEALASLFTSADMGVMSISNEQLIKHIQTALQQWNMTSVRLTYNAKTNPAVNEITMNVFLNKFMHALMPHINQTERNIDFFNAKQKLSSLKSRMRLDHVA